MSELPKEHQRKLRHRLFKKGERPKIRAIQPLDEQYNSDLGVLWAAYRQKSFPIPEGLSPDEFVQHVERTAAPGVTLWLIEDDNAEYRSGRGPIALVMTQHTELTVSPAPIFFAWATPKNKLRAGVGFLSNLRGSQKVGLVLARVPQKDVKFARKLERYGVLRWAGRAAQQEHLFYLAGRRSF